MPDLLSSSWGQIRMFCAQTNTDGSRTKVVHEPSSGSVHVVQDRGSRVNRTVAKLLFDEFEFTGAPLPIDAARIMAAAVDTGEVAVFTHPLLGSYLASVGDFHFEISESGVITADAEFIAEANPDPIAPTGAGSPAVSGENSVNAAADELDDVLAESGIGSSATDDGRASVASWSAGEEPAPPRQVQIDAARISNQIQVEIEQGGFEHDLELFGAFRAYIMFGDAIRVAAIAATSVARAVFTMKVTEHTALLPLAARVYGGADAAQRAADIAAMNDISTPGWLPPGNYTMPARSTGRRTPF